MHWIPSYRVLTGMCEWRWHGLQRDKIQDKIRKNMSAMGGNIPPFAKVYVLIWIFLLWCCEKRKQISYRIQKLQWLNHIINLKSYFPQYNAKDTSKSWLGVQLLSKPRWRQRWSLVLHHRSRETMGALQYPRLHRYI